MTKKLTFLPAIFTIILILAATSLGSYDFMVQKWCAFIALIVILILMFIQKSKQLFKNYTTPLFVASIGYIIWNGLSVFYADVPKLALLEFTKLIAAFAVFLTVLTLASPSKRGIKTVFGIMATSTAFLGIVSIDAASNGPIAAIFKNFIGLFTSSMQYWGGFESGIRITSIFANANTFAGFMVLGLFLSLSLVQNSDSKKERTIALVLLALNSLSYILLFSMGSLFMFFIACIIMIFVSKKGERLSIFVLMVETAVITLIFMAVALITLGSSPVIPLLAIALNALVLWLFDNYLRQPITNRLSANAKLSMIIAFVIIFSAIGYIIAAINITGPLSLNANETVMRACYLKGGEYKLNSIVKATDGTRNSETAPRIRIVTQNMTDLKVHTSTELYNGPLEAAQFTVPDDSKIIKLYLTGSSNGATIEQSTYETINNNTKASDTQEGHVKLGYKLLPSIVANRIQDLRANENSVQRMVFFQDGIKLFIKSPIIGNGLSGYETGVSSVQNFYYETKYVHNHYIEALCDLGIIGFAFFIGILILCVLAVLKLLKQSKATNYTNASAFALPVMAACIFQMFGQAITDLTWSSGPFLLIAFSMLALLIILTSDALKKESSFSQDLTEIASPAIDKIDAQSNNKTIITGGTVSRIGIVTLAFMMTVLIGLSLYSHYKAATGNCTMAQIASLTKLDKFESDDYKTTYIVTASTYGLEENLEQANQFAGELTHNPDAVLNYVLPYYFNTAQDDKLFETASISVRQNKANPEMWNRLFEVFADAIDPNRDNPAPVLNHLFSNKEYYIDGLLGYYKELQKRNSTYLDDAMLNGSNLAFIGKLLGIGALDKSDLIQAIDIFSNTIFNSQFVVDANNDGVPDNISVLSGSTTWGKTAASKEKATVAESGFDGTMTASAGTVMEMATYCVRGGEYTVRLSGLSGLEGNDVPKDITAAIDGQPVSVQYDQDGAFVKVQLKGAVPADEANKIQATAASTEKIVITFPTGAQMTKVTIKK